MAICDKHGDLLSKSCRGSSGSNLKDKWVLNLSSKELSELERRARFSIYNNKIKTIWRGLLENFPALKHLDFSANEITEIQDNLLEFSRNLTNLDLSNNKLAEIQNAVFAVDNQLEYLDLSNNEIKTLPQRLFASVYKLKYLDLSNNKLVEIPKDFFAFDNELEYLSLGKNPIKRFHQNSMENLKHLRLFDISKMPGLYIQNWKFLLKMEKLKTLKASVFSQCCFANKERTDINCIAPHDSFSDCDAMIKSNVLRYIVWVVLVGIIAGNLVSFILRISYQDKSYIQNIFIHNLHVGDIFMGMYVAAVVTRDLVWSGNYYLHDHEWRSSIACKSFGAIALISSEVCVLTLAVITYDRRAKLVHDVKDDTMRHRTVWLILSSIWLISSAIAVVPAVVKNYFYDEEKGEGYYGTNGLCLPLQLPGEKDPAWEYCLAVFGVFNFLVACYMAWAYCTIFYTSYVSVRASENAKAMKDERKMAIRFCFIVFTDILCWFPIAILIYISLAGIVSDKENKLYAWFSICVATINSVINPFIYTITTPLFWPKFKGWFEKISRCCEKCNCNNGQQEYQSSNINAERRIVTCNIEETGNPNVQDKKDF